MEKIEKIAEEIRERNDGLIENFALWLKSSGLKESTVKNHVGNIDFFLNSFLVLNAENVEDGLANAEDGINEFDYFFDDWFIRKAMWSDESSVKSNIASIKKFYTFMASLKLISKEQLKDLKEEIKESKDDWIESVNRYNDPSVDYYEGW